MIGRRGSRLARIVALALWIESVPALAAGVSVDAATPDQVGLAQKQFEAASALYDRAQYEEALSAFLRSHDVVQSPNSSLMAARCLLRLGRVAEAYRALSHTKELAETLAKSQEKYAQTAQAAQAELERVRAKVGLVRLELRGASASEGRVRLSGRMLEPGELSAPIAVEPGSNWVEVTPPAGPSKRQSFELAAGEETTVAVELEAEPAVQERPPIPSLARASARSSPNTLRTLSYVAGGVGAAGLVTFGVFGVMNNAKYGDLQDSCSGNVCPSSRADDIDTGRRYQAIANVGLGVAVVGIAAGVTLFLLSNKTKGSATTGFAQRGALPFAGSF